MLAAYIRGGTKLENRCLIALQKIRNGENTYYKDRLKDKEFVDYIDYLIMVESERTGVVLI